MGYYINPPHGTKEKFLQEHGELLDSYPEKNFDGTNVVVCLVVNPGFSAAAICYSQVELEYFQEGFANGTDPRPHSWFLIPVSYIEPFMKGKVIQ